MLRFVVSSRISIGSSCQPSVADVIFVSCGGCIDVCLAWSMVSGLILCPG